MASKNIQRVTASGRLSAAEAAEARRLRELAAKDKQEILAIGRALLAEKRRRQADAAGTATLGEKIRAAREARGLTQAELAARAHIAQAYLSYLEQDQREPSLAIAARLSRELGVTLDDLASSVVESG